MSELEKRTLYWQSHGLSARAVNCLAYGGVASLEEVNVSVLLTLRSCGVKTDAEIASLVFGRSVDPATLKKAYAR